MSSKELLPDATRTLFKKVRRSFSGNSKTPSSKDVLSLDTSGKQDLVLVTEKQAESRPPSYTSIEHDVKSPEVKTPLSPEWVDLDQTQTASSEAAALEATESQILDQATAAFAPPPPDAELPPLPKPVLVPRVDPHPNLPFSRAWAPELERHSISKEDFVSFIDALNIMITPHQGIYVVQVAALGVGFIPWDGADGVSAALEAIAILATIIHAHKRTKKYLQRMNDTYFHPRKLHVKLTTTKKMMKLLSLDKKDPLLAPLTEETLDLTAQERCLQHLSQWICELTLKDLPPFTRQTTMLARIAQWEVKHRVRKADRRAQWSRKRAWKKHQKGKPLKEGKSERMRIKVLSWIMVQNLDEWEATKAAKEAKKLEKKQMRRASTWRSIVS